MRTGKSRKKRIALTVSIPVVIVFVGFLIALVVPANIFILTEALSRLGLLGGRDRIAGLVTEPPGPAPAPHLLIINGTLWDAARGKRPNPGLAISGGRLVSAPAPGARVIDAAGLTILPGLIDMHVHSFGGTFAGEMMIGNGVTTARDLGTQLEGVIDHRDQAERGERIAPRLFVTGPYLVGAAGASDQEIEAPAPDAARAIVARFADAGVDGIKVHWGIGAETLKAVVEQAHGRGLWVAVHPDRVGAGEAARLGADTIEHAWSLTGGGGAEVSRSEDAMAALVEAGVPLTPTLVVAEHAFTIRDLAREGTPALACTPRFMRRFWISTQITNAAAERLSAVEIERRGERLRRLQEMVGRFHRAGGRVLAGTDAPAYLVGPGFDLHRELELLVGSGLAPAEALAAATSEAAAALGRSEELGGLSPGMRADLLIVDGDPLAGGPGDPSGISATRRAVVVVKDGHILLDRLGKLTGAEPRR